MIIFKSEKSRQLDEVCREHGYRVKSINCYNKGSVRTVKILAHNDEMKHRPDVFWSASDSQNPGISIRTPAIDALSVSDFREYIKAHEGVLNMVEKISRIDIEGITSDDLGYDYEL